MSAAKLDAAPVRPNATRDLKDHTEAEQDWFFQLALEWVKTVSVSLARGEMRRQAALMYIMMAASSEFADGAGNAETVVFLERLAAVLRPDSPIFDVQHHG